MNSILTRNIEFHKYIMSNILGLFGKDINSNFVLLFTFCDGGPLLSLIFTHFSYNEIKNI